MRNIIQKSDFVAMPQPVFIVSLTFVDIEILVGVQKCVKFNSNADYGMTFFCSSSNTEDVSF